MQYNEMRISSLIYMLENRRAKYGDVKVAIVTDGSTKTFRNLLEVTLPKNATHNLCCLVASKRPGAEK